MAHGSSTPAPLQSLLRTTAGTAVAALSAFAGPLLVLVLNLARMARLRVDRGGGGVSAELVVSFTPLQASLVAIAALLAAVFYGHLAADAVACSNGLRSAC